MNWDAAAPAPAAAAAATVAEPSLWQRVTRRWSVKQMLVAAALAIGLLSIGAVAGAAASDHRSDGREHSDSRFGDDGRPGGDHDRGRFGSGDELHRGGPAPETR